MNTQPPTPKVIGLKDIDASDLKSIKEQDPFLYYSIPGVRSAELLGKDIDTSDLGTCQFKSASCCPTRSQRRQIRGRSHTVTRSTRISFECHPDLLYDDVFSSSEEDWDGSDDALDLVLERLLAAERQYDRENIVGENYTENQY